MSDITLLCEKCSFPISDHKPGALAISYGAINSYELASAEWEAKHPGDVHTAAELMSMPDGPCWRSVHDACEPDSDAYDIGHDRLRTWADLTRWTAHLLGKRWLTSTDWDQVLREAAGEIESRRIRAVGSVAA